MKIYEVVNHFILTVYNLLYPIIIAKRKQGVVFSDLDYWSIVRNNLRIVGLQT